MAKIINTIPKLDFKDVLILPNKTTIKSRKEVCIEREFIFKNGKKWKGVPIISSNMDTVSDLNTFDVLRHYDYITCFPKHFNEKWFELEQIPEQLSLNNNYMLTCGTSQRDRENLFSLINRLKKCWIPPSFICVDVANGYMQQLQDTCLEIKDCFPDCILVAGNVVTPDIVYELMTKSGVDIVKIGIGSGAVCTTRLKAGVGYPQLSTILDCKTAAMGGGGYLISDGGIIHPCDIAKAFAAGSDFVMCGSILAGHEESPGELVIVNGQKYKTFYGMASETAVKKYNDNKMGYRTAEGKKVTIKLKGSLINTIEDINGSLRSACSYTDSRNLKEFYNNTKFITVHSTHNTSFI